MLIRGHYIRNILGSIHSRAFGAFHAPNFEDNRRCFFRFVILANGDFATAHNYVHIFLVLL